MQRFTKKEVIIIVLFFVLYMVGYAWLIEPKESQSISTENKTIFERQYSMSFVRLSIICGVAAEKPSVAMAVYMSLNPRMMNMMRKIL